MSHISFSPSPPIPVSLPYVPYFRPDLKKRGSSSNSCKVQAIADDRPSDSLMAASWPVVAARHASAQVSFKASLPALDAIW